MKAISKPKISTRTGENDYRLKCGEMRRGRRDGRGSAAGPGIACIGLTDCRSKMLGMLGMSRQPCK